jgi:ParB-like chromosome segregation protein Spo0J
MRVSNAENNTESTLPPMAVHDVAKMLPTLSAKARKELRDDIQANGIRVPILVNKAKDTILDGRNRWQIAYELGFTPDQVPQEVFKGKDEEIPSVVLSRNLFRRHLTEDQRVQLVDKILHLHLEAAARARMKAGKSDPVMNSIERGKYADALADKANVSQHKARQAIKARKAGYADEVIAAKMRSKDAAKAAPRKTRRKAVKTLKQELWEWFSRFMKKFDRGQHREVRAILRGFIEGKTPEKGDDKKKK